MKLEELIVRLKIEEDNYKSEKKSGTHHMMESKANIVEDWISLNKKRKYTGDRQNQDFKEFKGKYYNCGKSKYRSKIFASLRT